MISEAEREASEQVLLALDLSALGAGTRSGRVNLLSVDPLFDLALIALVSAVDQDELGAMLQPSDEILGSACAVLHAEVRRALLFAFLTDVTKPKTEGN